MSPLARALVGVRLAFRGLWYRRSTALIVLVLSVVASAASVVAPLYSRAAEESIVRDTLQRADPATLSVQISVPTSGGGAGFGDARDPGFVLGKVRADLTNPAFGKGRLAYIGGLLFHPTAGDFNGGKVSGMLVDRPGVCAHLPVTEGRCPTAPDEAMLSRRSLELIGAKVGQTLTADFTDAGSGRPTLTMHVVGSFDPVPVDSPYWAGHPYFESFYPRATPVGMVGENPPVADPVFLGAGSAEANGVTRYTVDVPVRPDLVRLDDTTALSRQIRRLNEDMSGYLLNSSSQLPAALQRASDGRDLVRIAAPLAVAQLVLLSWWTLFLVVGSATEERSPELGLAKLRGLSGGQTSRFGLAEIVWLLLVAAPLGTVLGYLAVRGAASHVFAPGTQVVLTRSVLLTVSAALAGGVVTAALAARRVFRRPVGDLLRRVPSRRAGKRAGLLEGLVLALAVAGVVQLVSDRGQRPSPVALLAPGMVAVAGGLLAGRLLVSVARSRVDRATERGRAAHLVGWSGVARRPGTARIASVLAVATCLLIVGVEAWTVAERNRVERATAETGAAVVLHVRAPGPRELLAAVRDADPAGGYAMAAVQVDASNQEPSVLAVDATRADRVVAWGTPGAGPARSLRSLLLPPLPPSIVVRPGQVTVTATTSRLRSPSPVTLSLRLAHDGASLQVPLGALARGRHTYRGTVPGDCSTGCRLAALALSHPGTDIENASVRVTYDALAAGPAGALTPVDAGFAVPGGWRPTAPSLGGPRIAMDPGRALTVDSDFSGGLLVEAVHGDAPEPLPAFASAGSGARRGEAGAVPIVTASGLSGDETRFRAVGSGPFVPHVGGDSVLVDLGLALRLSDAAPSGDRQVWLSRDDRHDERALVAALGRSGIRVDGRESRVALERRYAGDGAVLALRLLLVCGSAAVLVSVGALLVAAYVGRRQRAYEVAALRVVGLSRRTVRSLLLRENLGTVLVALVSGGLAALVATWVVLPSLPQFDDPSDTVAVRYTPDAASGWAAVGGLGLLLVIVGLLVAALQLRGGRSDRLREGVR